jgi:hypothetical protein
MSSTKEEVVEHRIDTDRSCSFLTSCGGGKYCQPGTSHALAPLQFLQLNKKQTGKVQGHAYCEQISRVGSYFVSIKNMRVYKTSYTHLGLAVRIGVAQFVVDSGASIRACPHTLGLCCGSVFQRACGK